jgi:proline iminopeptidase
LFYDQYGCGRSDRAVNPDEYDIELFVDELASVRQQLAPGPVHLYAHSYGGPVLLEYMIRRQPTEVLSLTLSNTFASTRSLAQGWDRRLAELSREHGEALRAGPAIDGEAFGAALYEFMRRFILPMAPPEPLERSQRHSGAEVYRRMHGSSWFEPDGEWSEWDATGELGSIAAPALVMGGTHDQCVPELAQALAAGISKAELVVLEAAHLPFFEVPDTYLRLVGDFLNRVEADR